MKSLMLIPPAQAEALYDTQEEAPVNDRFAPLPWLDDDAFEDVARAKASRTALDFSDTHTSLRRRAA